MSTTTIDQGVSSDVTPPVADVVMSRYVTIPDAATMRAAALALGVDISIAEAAIENILSGNVTAAVFSGKMASGKDTVAEEVGNLLATSGLASAKVHRTSDPIRSELDHVIALVTAASDPLVAARDVASAMVFSEEVSRHLVDCLFEPTRSQVVRASDRTDENRHLLQYLADAGRRSVDPDYWIKQFFARMVTSLGDGHSAFLSGCRYPNEIIPAQSLGMITVRLEVSRAEQERRLTGRDGLRPNPLLLEDPNECALDNFTGFNLVVNNDGALGPTLEAVTAEVLAHSYRLTR